MFEEEYGESCEVERNFNIGNCKRCVNKSSCGTKPSLYKCKGQNKNKKEASWCDRYRPEIKKKRGKRR